MGVTKPEDTLLEPGGGLEGTLAVVSVQMAGSGEAWICLSVLPHIHQAHSKVRCKVSQQLDFPGTTHRAKTFFQRGLGNPGLGEVSLCPQLSAFLCSETIH